MVQLVFDASAIDVEYGAGQLPVGDLIVAVTESGVRESRSSGNELHFLNLEVQGGEHAGATGEMRFNTGHPNIDVRRISEQNLGRVIQAVGFMSITDTLQLHGRPFMVSVRWQDEEEKRYTEIKKILYANGAELKNMAGGGPKPATLESQPATQPAGEWVEQPVTQPTQPATQPAGEWAPATQPAQPVHAQPATQPATTQPTQPVHAQPATQPVAQPTQPVHAQPTQPDTPDDVRMAQNHPANNQPVAEWVPKDRDQSVDIPF